MAYLEFFSRNDFEEAINFKLNKKNILITYHPVTLENNTSEAQFNELLGAIEGLEDTNFIFTMPNSDMDGRIIMKQIEDYISENRNRACAFKSMGQKRYLSALSHVDVVLGNSSSGLAEAPSFKIATINIGDRQRGRIRAESVIDCKPESEEIKKALTKAFSTEFRNKLKSVKNPYGEGGASEKIVETLKTTDLKNILKKKFYDLKLN